MISIIIAAGGLKICVQVLRVECRSEAKPCFDCLSITRIMMDDIHIFEVTKNANWRSKHFFQVRFC